MSDQRSMTNIPTDLLRALTAVVDHRSFTKAAGALGVTQPAVSTQIKRLQILLECEVFDRSDHDLKLTPQGQLVVDHARRLLSLNDEIMQIGRSGTGPNLMIRIGTPSDAIASRLPSVLMHFRNRQPDVRFDVRTDSYDLLQRDLYGGRLDLLIGLSFTRPFAARHSWAREVVWVRGLTTILDANRTVPLVSFGEHSVYHRLAVQALKEAGLDWEVVFTGHSLTSLGRAVIAGLGIMPIVRNRVHELGLLIMEDGPLPKLPDVYGGIFVREGGIRPIYEQLADDIVDLIAPDRPGVPKLSPALELADTTAA